MVPSMKPNTVSVFKGNSHFWREGSSGEFFGFGVFFPLRALYLLFNIGWNMALEPDYSVSVFLLDSVAEIAMLRLQMHLFFVVAENTVAST